MFNRVMYRYFLSRQSHFREGKTVLQGKFLKLLLYFFQIFKCLRGCMVTGLLSIRCQGQAGLITEFAVPCGPRFSLYLSGKGCRCNH